MAQEEQVVRIGEGNWSFYSDSHGRGWSGVIERL